MLLIGLEQFVVKNTKDQNSSTKFKMLINICLCKIEVQSDSSRSLGALIKKELMVGEKRGKRMEMKGCKGAKFHN